METKNRSASLPTINRRVSRRPLLMTNNLSTLREQSDLILAKAEQWKNEGGFRHRKPCKEWIRYKHCDHYAIARYRHFKGEIDLILKGMNFK